MSVVGSTAVAKKKNNFWGKMKKGDLPDVPIEELDYKYLKTCDDVEELKDIVINTLQNKR